MAGVDIGGGKGGKRQVNADLNMIPFIDLLMVTVAFLLITAVWTTHSRIDADVNLPGPPGPIDTITPPEKVLHVHVGESEFTLTWRLGETVVSEAKLPKAAVAADAPSYPDLAKRLATEWSTFGGHRDPADRRIDQVVLHTDNRLPFKEVVAVMDAIYAPKRPMIVAAAEREVPVFNMTFASR